MTWVDIQTAKSLGSTRYKADKAAPGRRPAQTPRTAAESSSMRVKDVERKSAVMPLAWISTTAPRSRALMTMPL
jgi:hypothetical protein